ncbi:histidine kinase [Actinomadura sp. SCN-SB]|uniref:PAS domain-containing sensor histidine kinase n=1 Tax=Actinomadura sp. SCN-SB TaxID=3373092 RepID=UPI003751069D
MRVPAGPALSSDLVAAMVEAAPDGIALLDEEGACLHVNPEGLRILGAAAVDVLGRPLFARPREHLAGPSRRVVRDDGTEIEYEARRFRTGDGETRWVLVFRDAAAYTRVERRLMAFTNAAASVAARSGSLAATLDRVAGEVVQATAMAACQVVLTEPGTATLRMIGQAGLPLFPPDFPERFEQARRRGAHLLTLDALRTGGVQIGRGQAAHVLTDPAWEPLRPVMAAFSWDTYISVPLTVGGRTLGVLNGFYPPDHDPGEEEVAFLRTMCDQAAIAVENARLLDEAEGKAALEERQRIARDLHDSVCQSLFSLTLRMRAVELAAERLDAAADPDGRLRANVATARRLAHDTLAEMRGLVLELRPGALPDLGLEQAVRQHAAAVAVREGLAVDVRGSAGDGLDDDTVENLYRIFQEALHNVVKHACARTVQVRLGRDGEGVLEVGDDGRGFDPSAPAPGRLGLVGMAERARRIGADLTIDSAPGRGTRLRVDLRNEHSNRRLNGRRDGDRA